MAACSKEMPSWATPMIMPPMMLMKVIRMPAIASPRTNFEAPSIAPKKLLSPSSSLRRLRASSSLIMPAERSASIAICLPGIASSVNRAATSAIRPEPLVTTMKFTMIRMMNTTTPITKLPPITKPPKTWMMLPAASGPSWPWARIRRVVAMLRASRSSVASNSTVGKAENSSGFLISSAVIRMRTDSVIEIASKKSSRNGGMGMMSIITSAITPRPSAYSPRANSLVKAFRSKGSLLRVAA